ncbi:MAG: ABC transporter permease subunit [Treponema sp.]|nr:ABC transporter permease subunit [Treponema sp.]
MNVDFKKKLKLAKQNYVLYLLILPAFTYIVCFQYLPIYGAQIAFRNYRIQDGIIGSPWVGLQWFKTFFTSPRNRTIIWNTVIISIYNLLAGFPIPIIFALLLNQVKSLRYKKLVQTVTYMPHFISMVVIIGMISVFFSPTTGFINKLIGMFTGQNVYYLGMPKYYYHLFVWSGVWQSFGWGSIIYMASLSSVDTELYEAAMIDGANRLQQVIYIDIPHLKPTMIILLILATGNIMNVGFEKSWLMQNDLNISVSEVISTYTYRIGIMNSMFSYSAAIGLFNNVVNFIFLVMVNFLSKRVSDNSLW